MQLDVQNPVRGPFAEYFLARQIRSRSAPDANDAQAAPIANHQGRNIGDPENPRPAILASCVSVIRLIDLSAEHA